MPDDLPAALGHRFAHPELLEQALTHRSWGARHNERLEFVGDAVLNCVIAHELYQRFPDLPEGDLSRARASLVNRDMLADVARRLDLGSAVRLGEGEQRSGGPERPSILADAFEAVLGAVFLDAGFEASRAAVTRAFDDVLRDADPAALGKDPKTRLQEWLQARRLPLPDYRVVDVAGEAHAQTFTAECAIPAFELALTGSGSSRRAAEQAAAEAAWRAAVAAARKGQG